ncbi:MAG: hypothetical protein KIS96_11440 [Bauldia sp.]|nr:hypothetical protein [Bauldia sp.]MCW5697329.1 hypothetical protein [Bauldia sp.]
MELKLALTHEAKAAGDWLVGLEFALGAAIKAFAIGLAAQDPKIAAVICSDLSGELGRYSGGAADGPGQATTRRLAAIAAEYAQAARQRIPGMQ